MTLAPIRGSSSSFSLRDKRAQIQLAVSERDEQITRASKALEFVRPSALRRADVVRQQQVVDDILEGLNQLKKKNDTSTWNALSSLGIDRYNVPLQQKSGFKPYKDHSAHAE